MDMNQIMRQAQEFQQKMTALQAELAERTVSSSVGGGMVQATVNGRHQLVDLRIEKEVINPDDPEMLRDLVVAAVNDAMNRAQEMIKVEMGKLTGGMNIPGLF
ncbi:YbaB/EbfC family nucleoid-associated protein [Desulfurivibrio sp. C05AmB]|jgi:nucleoid-associated protein EbfC|uniref:YbaB/EbfC family nucleoid-associated protein n=1 Tax=Desulfurivibrio sp. C05AmB TaxID=3374371 RepID=UPI00376F0EC5